MPQYNNEYYAQEGYPPSHGQQYAQSHYAAGPGYAPASQAAQERGPSPYPPQEPYQRVGENASYYGDFPPSQQGYAPGQEGPEGERGLSSTVVGGAAGGYAAHHMGGGKMATAGAAVLGAAGMNMVTRHMKKQCAAQAAPPAPVVVVAAPAAPAATSDAGLGLGLHHGMGLRGHLGRRAAARRNLMGI
ncbi:hypothetical protein BO71DRAFT_443534 [Aspergillus ellipticus CBS 707.79]|uniref:Glycine zipper 2TM domain-containing protein n=1 Tax=Aspergillus ellipticus CBS 707.79 TaxID=1448320 RepID=A0A319D0W5_9EURO|nr:hypothetical protein BO71DRAFT_443534 [Aspergillus ellipticus CBS 707.79]